MKSMQDRILGQIEKAVIDRGYSPAVAHSFANIGTVYIFDEEASDEHVTFPCASVKFSFQSDSYTLSLTVKGQRIPSQIGRADYFDFYQSYSQPTRFWEELDASLPPLLHDACEGSVMHYDASQTTGDDDIVRLCERHAVEAGYGIDQYAGSAAENALCDESTVLKALDRTRTKNN